MDGQCDDEERIAGLLFERARRPHLDDEIITAFDPVGQNDIERAMAINLRILGHWEAIGDRLGGWKAGLTSRGARDSMGKGIRPFAHILESRIFATDAEIKLSDISTGVKLEPEICVSLGKRLSGEVSVAEVKAAVASVHPSFELIERRLFSALLKPSVRVADGLGQWGIVVGPPHPPDVELSSLRVDLLHNGAIVDSGVSAPEILDDPYLSIARICAELARHGRSLEPGQKIITGNLVDQPLIVEPGYWTARFGPIGEVHVRFVP